MKNKLTQIIMSLVYCLGCILFLIGLACLGFVVPIDFIIAIVAGWAFFLARVFPQLTVDWGGVTIAIFASLFFLFGVHKLGRLVCSQVDSLSWTRKRSAALSAAVFLIFCAGIAMIGVGHQVIWIAISDEPLTETSSVAHDRMRSHYSLEEIGLAFHNYHDANNVFPPKATFDSTGRPLQSWLTFLLPYLGREELLSQIDQKIPWDDPRNEKLFQQEIYQLLNHRVLRNRVQYREPVEYDAQGRALTHYAANANYLSGLSLKITEIPDGVSHTMLAGEVNANFRPWGDPLNIRDPQLGLNKSPHGFGGPFEGGVHVLYADGHVDFVSENIDPQVFEASGTPAGGEKF